MEQRLDERMATGKPPDVFQVHGGVRLMDWVKYNGVEGEKKLEPLDDVAASSGWLSAVPESVVETVTHNGRVYAVPVNVHRLNCLFYNKKLFAENELTPPTTLDELYAVNEAFAAQGITPLAVAAEDPSTPANLMWEHLFVMSAGAQYYDDLFKGRLASPARPRARGAMHKVRRATATSGRRAARLSLPRDRGATYAPALRPRRPDRQHARSGPRSLGAPHGRPAGGRAALLRGAGDPARHRRDGPPAQAAHR
ncbi:ABC transporter substrate-binding protein [Sorangium sp. So ce1128]